MIKRIDIFHLWRKAKKGRNAGKIDETWVLFKEKYNIESLDARKKIVLLCKLFLKKWNLCSRRDDAFLSTYSAWLEEDFGPYQEEEEELIYSPDNLGGRPKKSFSDSSSRTKRRRIATIAAIDEDIACALKHCQSTDSLKAKQLNSNDALKILVEAKLTKHQYQVIRNLVNEKTEVDVFPSYAKVIKAKKDCYPEPEKISISDTSAEVSLQGLLNHTAQRIVESQKEVFENLEIDLGNTIK